MIDCMTCLTQLAEGCPTNGLQHKDAESGITHALVTIRGTHFEGVETRPAHGFRWSGTAGRWMFFVGLASHWAVQHNPCDDP